MGSRSHNMPLLDTARQSVCDIPHNDGRCFVSGVKSRQLHRKIGIYCRHFKDFLSGTEYQYKDVCCKEVCWSGVVGCLRLECLEIKP
jgi:hypothetical protein